MNRFDERRQGISMLREQVQRLNREQNRIEALIDAEYVWLILEGPERIKSPDRVKMYTRFAVRRAATSLGIPDGPFDCEE